MVAGPVHTLDVDEALERIAERGQGRWTVFCVIVLSVNSTVQALETNLLPYLGNCAAADFKIPAVGVSALFSSVFIGLIVGAFIFAPLADVVGRRTVLVWTTWFLFIFSMLSAIAPTFETLMVLRALVGVMEGAWTVSIDLLAEFVPANRRGNLLNLGNLGWGIGSAYVALLAWGVIPVFGWRAYVAVATLPMAFSAVTMMYLEESPRWLVREGQTSEAYQVVKRIAAFEGVEVPCAALQEQGGDSEHAPLASSCDSAGQSWSRVLANARQMINEYSMVLQGTRRGMTLLVCAVWACWGFTYSGIVFFDGSVLGSTDSIEVCSFNYPLTTMLSVADIVGAAALIPFIDATGGSVLNGRRGTQMVPYLGCAISTLFIGLGVRPLPAWAFISRGLICAGSSASVVQVAELFDTKVRATANGVVSIVNNLAGILASYWVLAPLSQLTIVSGIAAVNLLAAILVFWLPETAQTSLVV